MSSFEKPQQQSEAIFKASEHRLARQNVRIKSVRKRSFEGADGKHVARNHGVGTA